MNHRSAGSFCSLVAATTTGTSDSVTSQDVAAVGNGAECFCLANSAVYRYNSASAQTTIGTTFLQPLSGGGCWFKQDAEADYTHSISLGVSGIGTSITSNANWQALPSGATAYKLISGVTSSLWSLDTTTGISTYLGPSGAIFLFEATASINSGSVGLGADISMYLSINGALIGTNPVVAESALLSSIPANFQLSHNLCKSLNSGDTVQNIVIVSGAAHTQVFNRYQLQITKP